MIGPGVVIVAAKLIVLFMSLKAAFTINNSIVAYGNLRYDGSFSLKILLLTFNYFNVVIILT